MQGERKPTLVIRGAPFAIEPAVSPDGKWIAYTSTTAGRPEIYVSRFPEGTGKWQLSTVGGNSPRWSHDGKELFFMSPDRNIMRVPVTSGAGSFEAGTPVALFRSNAVFNNGYSYEPTVDGQRFLVNSLDAQDSLPLVMVVNWKTELKK